VCADKAELAMLLWSHFLAKHVKMPCMHMTATAELLLYDFEDQVRCYCNYLNTDIGTIMLFLINVYLLIFLLCMCHCCVLFVYLHNACHATLLAYY